MNDINDRLTQTLTREPSRTRLRDSSLTHSGRDVDAITRRIAGAIVARGIHQDDVVLIREDDRLSAVLLMIGVIRSGAAFCFLPSSEPPARVALVNARVQPSASIDSLDALLAEVTDPPPPLPRRAPDSLAYVIFTSGSTGEPKAVEITDRGLAYIADQPDLYRGTSMGQLATLQFDACIYEIFGGLLNDMAVIVVDRDELLDLDLFPTALRGVDSIFLTTQLFNLFVDRRPEVFDGLSSVIFGGERVSVDHVRRARTRTRRLIHAYGPTETTVYATVHLVDSSINQVVPIGAALHGAQIRVASTDPSAEVPVDGTGELLIAGDGLMRGYRGDAAATAEALVTIEGRAYYRTGDMVRRDVGGGVTFVGRKDRQLKISGFRIDPAETEATAHRSGQVEQAVAIGDGTKLRLFVTGCTDIVRLRTYLRQNLPSYAVPVVTAVQSIPLTKNGKTNVDELMASASRSGERRLRVRNAFFAVLKVDAVDPTETFIDLGGDSIAAMEAIWQLDTDGIQIELDELFTLPLQTVIDNA